MLDEMVPKRQKQYSISYTASYGNTAGSSFTLTNCDIGAEDPDREVFAIIGWFATLSYSLSSATINGVTATLETQFSSNSRFLIAVRAQVPVGTSVTIVLNFSGSVSNCSVSLYRVVRKNKDVAATSQNNNTGSGTSSSITTSAPIDGFVLTGLNTSASSSDYSVGGVGTVTFDASLAPNSTGYCAFGHSGFLTSAVSSGTVTWSWTTSRTYNSATWSFS